MKQCSIQFGLTVAIGFSVVTAQAAVVNTGDQLTINSGIYNGGDVATGSWFAADTDGDNVISGFEKTALHQGTEGIIIGVTQGAGTPTHSGAPLPTDWNRITAPYSWFSNTGQEYTTSPITGSTETGLDFSGFNWLWNGTEDLSFGTGAWGVGYTDGIANFVWDGIYGHSYTLDYRTTVEEGGFIGVQFAYHFEGVVNPVPLPAAMWLFGSGLIGLVGLARRKKT